MSFEKIISIGRGLRSYGGSKRGALIQMEGNVVYMRDSKGSLLYKLIFKKPIGTGTFYAGEAPLMSKRIERRDGKVVFEWRESTKIRRVWIAEPEPFDQLAENALSRLYTEPNVSIPLDIFDVLDPDILVTRLSISGNSLVVRQTRSDGSVMLETVLEMRRLGSQSYEDIGEVSFFTSNLYVLKGHLLSLRMGLREDAPISIRAKTNFDAELVGLISHLKYER